MLFATLNSQFKLPSIRRSLTWQICGYFSLEYAREPHEPYQKPFSAHIAANIAQGPGSAGTRWAAYSAPADRLAELRGLTFKGIEGREGKGYATALALSVRPCSEQLTLVRLQATMLVLEIRY